MNRTIDTYVRDSVVREAELRGWTVERIPPDPKGPPWMEDYAFRRGDAAILVLFSVRWHREPWPHSSLDMRLPERGEYCLWGDEMSRQVGDGPVEKPPIFVLDPRAHLSKWLAEPIEGQAA